MLLLLLLLLCDIIWNNLNEIAVLCLCQQLFITCILIIHVIFFLLFSFSSRLRWFVFKWKKTLKVVSKSKQETEEKTSPVSVDFWL